MDRYWERPKGLQPACTWMTSEWRYTNHTFFCEDFGMVEGEMWQYEC